MRKSAGTDGSLYLANVQLLECFRPALSNAAAKDAACLWAAELSARPLNVATANTPAGCRRPVTEGSVGLGSVPTDW